MARKVSIFGKSTVVKGFAVKNGDFVPVEMVLSGSKSDNVCAMSLRAEFGLDTLFASKEIIEGEPVELDYETFLAYSRNCIEGVSYGHATVSRECKITLVKFATIVNGLPAMNALTYNGVTTKSKLRKWLADALEDRNVALVGTQVIKLQRFMPKALFTALADGMQFTTEELDAFFAPYEREESPAETTEETDGE